MAIRVYATPGDYQAWTGATPPPGIEAALRAASLLVETEMLRTALYDTDSAGMPTETEVVEAIRDAVCAQAQYGQAAGDPQMVGAGQVTAFQIGGISVQRGQASGREIPAHWSPQAWAILQAVDPAKLCWRGIWSR